MYQARHLSAAIAIATFAVCASANAQSIHGSAQLVNLVEDANGATGDILVHNNDGTTQLIPFMMDFGALSDHVQSPASGPLPGIDFAMHHRVSGGGGGGGGPGGPGGPPIQPFSSESPLGSLAESDSVPIWLQRSLGDEEVQNPIIIGIAVCAAGVAIEMAFAGINCWGVGVQNISYTNCGTSGSWTCFDIPDELDIPAGGAGTLGAFGFFEIDYYGVDYEVF